MFILDLLNEAEDDTKKKKKKDEDEDTSSEELEGDNKGEETPNDEDLPPDDADDELNDEPSDLDTEEENVDDEPLDTTESDDTDLETGTDTDEGGEPSDLDTEGEDSDIETDDGMNGDSGEEGEESQDNSLTLKLKNKKLLTELIGLHNSIDALVTHMNKIDSHDEVEAEAFKINQQNLLAVKNHIYEYVTTLFNSKQYEENLYNFYYFQSSVKISVEIIKKIIDLRNQP